MCSPVSGVQVDGVLRRVVHVTPASGDAVSAYARRVNGVLGRGVAALAWTLHVAFIVGLVLGGFAAWVWPPLLAVHLLVAAWGLWIVRTRRPCPLTALENAGRRRAGLAQLPPEGFIPHYLEGRLYPRAWARRVEVAVGVVVLVSWVGGVVLLLGPDDGARDDQDVAGTAPTTDCTPTPAPVEPARLVADPARVPAGGPLVLRRADGGQLPQDPVLVSAVGADAVEAGCPAYGAYPVGAGGAWTPDLPSFWASGERRPLLGLLVPSDQPPGDYLVCLPSTPECASLTVTPR